MEVPFHRFISATFFIVLAGLVLSIRTARASNTPVLEASFSLDGSPMKIRVAKKDSKMTASLFARGQAQAICEVTNYEQSGGNDPLSLELSCRGVGLAPLATNATVFWPDALGEKELMLRFGTWLTGYRKAPLKVRFDALSRS